MISTGTDVKPIECVFFLRNVKSAGFFEQMKGRGVRVISPDKLRVVSPSARVKDRFIIVDAVGVCEQDKTDSHTLNRQPSKTLDQVLEYAAQGGTDPEALNTLAGRLARLQREFTAAQLAELRDIAGGKSFPDLAHELLNACNSDAQIEAAMQQFAVAAPSEEQTKQAAEQLAHAAATPFLRASPHFGKIYEELISDIDAGAPANGSAGRRPALVRRGRVLPPLPKMLPNSLGCVGKKNDRGTAICWDFRMLRDSLGLDGSPATEFQDRCLKPLGHPSANRRHVYLDMRRQEATDLLP
jgi:hypothetical protein